MQKNPKIEFSSLRVLTSLRLCDSSTLAPSQPATWTVWLGCEGRAPEGQPLPRGASPFIFLYPFLPFLPAIAFALGGCRGGEAPNASAY